MRQKDFWKNVKVSNLKLRLVNCMVAVFICNVLLFHLACITF